MPEIYAYMTYFTKGWLKYQNSYADLTKADFYMNFCFYRGWQALALIMVVLMSQDFLRVYI